MAAKQPRVPVMTEGTELAEYIRELALFLKDFCMDSWTQDKRQNEAIEDLRREIEAMKQG